MKTLLLFLATIQMIINCFGLELVKCGSVKIRINSPIDGYALRQSRPDGTSLFSFPLQNCHVILKPFLLSKVIYTGPFGSQSYSSETNDWKYYSENGVPIVEFKVASKTEGLVSDPELIFGTLSEKGYCDLVSVRNTFELQGVRVVGGVEIRNSISNVVSKKLLLRKMDLTDSVKEEVDITDSGFVDRKSLPGASIEVSLIKRAVFPRLNGDSIDFYLVTDPDLFPDTALGAPRVDGGSASFNVTTSSDEPVEIQSSSDLKVWKRIQSLENANGRSVTLPMGSDKEFLRLVEP
jgi:hypothetical protein